MLTVQVSEDDFKKQFRPNIVSILACYENGDTENRSDFKTIIQCWLINDTNALILHSEFFTSEMRTLNFLYHDHFSYHVITWTVNFRQDYVKKVFDNDQRLFDSLETNLPGTFEKYIETFRSYNLGDVCESYFAVKEPSKKVGKCNQMFLSSI